MYSRNMCVSALSATEYKSVEIDVLNDTIYASFDGSTACCEDLNYTGYTGILGLANQDIDYDPTY